MLAWDVKRWGVLPEAGGLRDQRVADLMRMRATMNVYDVMVDFRRTQMTWVEWMAQNPEAAELVGDIILARKAGREAVSDG